MHRSSPSTASGLSPELHLCTPRPLSRGETSVSRAGSRLCAQLTRFKELHIFPQPSQLALPGPCEAVRTALLCVSGAGIWAGMSFLFPSKAGREEVWRYAWPCAHWARVSLPGGCRQHQKPAGARVGSPSRGRRPSRWNRMFRGGQSQACPGCGARRPAGKLVSVVNSEKL